MKKRIIGLVCIGVLAGGLLAGCGSDSESSDGSSAAAETTEESSAAAEEETTVETNTEETGDSSTAEYSLSVQTHDPVDSATGEFLNAWAAEVSELSEGRISIRIYYDGSLGSATETLDLIRNGGCDIGWGLQSFFADTFPVTEVFELPMIDIDSAVQGSEALWNFYNNYDYMTDEYADYHVLALHSNCQSPISTGSVKLESISDLKGMQIRSMSGPMTDFVSNLGATPFSCTMSELYANFEDGVVDGCITDFHGIASFDLDEVIEYMLDANVGVSTYFLMMNQDSYDALPEDLQEVLDTASENALAYTSAWDDVEAEQREALADKLYTLDDEQMAVLEDAADTTITNWIADMDAAGYDGQAIYDDAMAEIEAAAQ